MLAVTDFPDIRLKAAIQSADEGNILLIPREGGYLVRLYVDLGEIDPNNREAFREKHTQDKVIAIAQRVLRPYTLDVKSVAWFAVYQVGQRVTDRFDDVPAEQAGSRLPRVFIAGDACHTHSAKAGQGMNVSMQDAFNLGWKLVSVLEGRAKPELLRTYSTERHAIAQGLIDFDKEWSKIMASPPKDPNRPELGGVDPAELQAYFVKSGRYTAGVATHYAPTTVLTAAATHQELAKGFTIGMRFHSAPVVRLADAKPMQLGHAARADGAWRIYAFADASGTATARARRLPGGVAEFADPPLHPDGGGHRQRHRRSRGLPAGTPRPQGRRAAVDAAAAQGALRADRLREGLLPRPQERPGHLRPARHRPRARARWSSSVPTSTFRTCCRWTRTTNSRPSSARSCSIASRCQAERSCSPAIWSCDVTVGCRAARSNPHQPSPSPKRLQPGPSRPLSGRCPATSPVLQQACKSGPDAAQVALRKLIG